VADRPASALDDAVEVMDRLRSPGGCPWDAAQSHRSLAPFLLEEAYEVLDAIDTGDDAALRDELGDLLMQVLFHARLAEENESDPWSIEDVATGLVEKLRRRHPHVFGEVTVDGAAQVVVNWEHIKAAERERSSITDGMPLGLPALALAAKLLARLEHSGLTVPSPAPGADNPASVFGVELLDVVRRAGAAGVDAEQALRETVLAYQREIRRAERVDEEPGEPETLP
jgi:XTP/dITP diphosphohydrolase